MCSGRTWKTHQSTEDGMEVGRSREEWKEAPRVATGWKMELGMEAGSAAAVPTESQPPFSALFTLKKQHRLALAISLAKL